MIFNSTIKMYVFGGLAACLLGTFLWLFAARANLKAELAQVRARESVCQSANIEWQDKAGQFEKAIQKMKEETQVQKERAEGLLLVAKNKAYAHEQVADALVHHKADQTDVCQAAAALFQDYLAKRQKGARP